MQYVHFLNLEYFILSAYQALTGGVSSTTPAQVSSQTVTLLTYIGWIGIALSLLLALGIFLAHRRLHAIEHAGWHRRAEEAAALERRGSAEAQVNPRWENILMLADSASENDWRRAVIDADTMLDEMLMSHGYVGENLGERLKDANPLQFTTLKLAWAAHRVRNDIAHGGAGYVLTAREARATIDLYRRVFEEFNYL